jgi:hypothetical protein
MGFQGFGPAASNYLVLFNAHSASPVLTDDVNFDGLHGG